MKKLLITIWLLCLLVLPVNARAKTITAESCSQEDVQAAVASAIDGDIVNIPNCPLGVIWSNNITVDEAITIVGGGIENTLIYDHGFSIMPGTNNWRITGISWEASSKPNTTTNIIVVGQASPEGSTSCTNFRIDHCKFDGFYRAVYTYNGARGVIDCCEFVDGRIDMAGQDDEWGEDTGLGTDKFLFIEDNIFRADNTPGSTYLHAAMGMYGAKFVFRYNTVQSKNSTYYIADAIDAHGFGHGTNQATRAYEIYKNTFIAKGSESRAINLRGGTGVVYNNIFDQSEGTYSIAEMFLQEYRLFVPLEGEPSECGNCATVVSGGILCQDCEGYPCCGQIGRGKNQASEPMYFWGNVDHNSNSVIPVVSSNCADYIRNTAHDGESYPDYYDDGTQPVGYIPYAYPHPLTMSCDITGDSLVNALDIQACVNHVLMKQDWGSAADVNNSGSVDAVDIQAIVNEVLRI